MRWRTWTFDTLLAGALLVLCLAVSRLAGARQPGTAAVDAMAYALVTVAVLALVGRRRWPVATMIVTVVAVSAYLLAGYPYGPVMISVVIAAYTLAAELPLRRAAPVAAAAIAVLLVHLLTGSRDWTGLLPGASLIAVPFAVGATARLGREQAARAREDRIRDAAYDTRLQVAQEVHDVVGHGLAAINMQAEIALHVLPKRPEQAEEALTAIARTSKEALDELRATLAVVRSDPSAPRTPGAGLDQLDALVERLGGTGVPIHVHVTGPRRDLPATVDLAAYRVVQESLTNVLRHAGKASATVRVTYRSDGVAVEVADDGRGPATPVTPGNGIPGMRTRVEAVGGTFTAGPGAGGGFRVRADLPVGGGPA
jgi:signal transduction histidine kinase